MSKPSPEDREEWRRLDAEALEDAIEHRLAPEQAFENYSGDLSWDEWIKSW